MANPVDDRGNVRVDHVWGGTLPPQPDDARPAEAKLDPDLGFHRMLVEGRYSFPGYTPNFVGDGDDVPNVLVPNVVGLPFADAVEALQAVGLDGVDDDTITDGATEENDGTVATQSPAAGEFANLGTVVDLGVFLFDE
jgi:hypothetical protein